MLHITPDKKVGDSFTIEPHTDRESVREAIQACQLGSTWPSASYDAQLTVTITTPPRLVRAGYPATLTGTVTDIYGSLGYHREWAQVKLMTDIVIGKRQKKIYLNRSIMRLGGAWDPKKLRDWVLVITCKTRPGDETSRAKRYPAVFKLN